MILFSVLFFAICLLMIIIYGLIINQRKEKELIKAIEEINKFYNESMKNHNNAFF